MKKKVAFRNNEVYGKQFRPGIKLVFPIVAKMLFDDKINVSGGINADKSDNINKSELFNYVYYLWYYNKTNIYPFNEMSDEKNHASGTLFYNSIKKIVDNDYQYNVCRNTSVTQISISGLIYFINKIVNENIDRIIIPIIDHLQILLKDETQKSISSISIKTSSNTNNEKIYKAQLLNDKNVNNGDIKIKFL